MCRNFKEGAKYIIEKLSEEEIEVKSIPLAELKHDEGLLNLEVSRKKICNIIKERILLNTRISKKGITREERECLKGKMKKISLAPHLNWYWRNKGYKKIFSKV